jgi:hypothetical protein
MDLVLGFACDEPRMMQPKKQGVMDARRLSTSANSIDELNLWLADADKKEWSADGHRR